MNGFWRIVLYRVRIASYSDRPAAPTERTAMGRMNGVVMGKGFAALAEADRHITLRYPLHHEIHSRQIDKHSTVGNRAFCAEGCGITARETGRRPPP